MKQGYNVTENNPFSKTKETNQARLAGYQLIF